jgi:transposase InsO family protein
VLPNEKKESAAAFLHAAIEYYASLGVIVTRVMTDNPVLNDCRRQAVEGGSCYNSFAFKDACKALGLQHIRAKPYTPKTNGKAERFIQTSLREWACARAYPTSEHRKQTLVPWLHNYNWHRPHGSLQAMPPISRLSQPMNNLVRLHITVVSKPRWLPSITKRHSQRCARYGI